MNIKEQAELIRGIIHRESLHMPVNDNTWRVLERSVSYQTNVIPTISGKVTDDGVDVTVETDRYTITFNIEPYRFKVD